MELLHQKYEQLTKCKPHSNFAKTICVHPFCLGKFVCEECLPHHPIDHKKNLISIQEFFSCTIKPDLDNKVHKIISIEHRTKKEVADLFNVVDDLFNAFEIKFFDKLKEIKEKTKQEISKPLHEIHLDIQYWIHLQEKLNKTYTEFIKTGLLDEMLFYNYTATYDKALSTCLDTNSYQQQANQNGSKNKKSVTADFKFFEELFAKIQSLIDDFSITYDFKPSFPLIPKVSYKQNNLSRIKTRAGESFQEFSKQSVLRSFRRKDSQHESFNNISINLPSSRIGHRKSQNYPLLKEGMSFQDLFSKELTDTRRLKKLENLYKYTYSLTNQKHFDSAHRGIVCNVLYVSELNLVITGGQEGKIKLWDLSTLKMQRTFDTHNRKILALKYLTKRNLLACACLDSIVKIFHLESESFKMWNLQGHSNPVAALEYAQNMDALITGGLKDQTIKIWNLSSMSIQFEFVQGDFGICTLFYVEGLSAMFAGLEKGIVRCYNMEKESLKESIDVSFGNPSKSKDIVNLNFDEEKNLLFCGNIDGTITIWSLMEYPATLMKTFSNNLKSARFLFLPKKGISIFTGKDKNVKIIDLTTGEIVHMYELMENEGSGITFIEKNQILISDLESSVIKIWTLTKNKSLVDSHQFSMSARKLSMPR